MCVNLLTPGLPLRHSAFEFWQDCFILCPWAVTWEANDLTLHKNTHWSVSASSHFNSGRDSLADRSVPDCVMWLLVTDWPTLEGRMMWVSIRSRYLIPQKAHVPSYSLPDSAGVNCICKVASIVGFSFTHRDTDDRVAGRWTEVAWRPGGIVVMKQWHHVRQRGEGDVGHAVGLLDVNYHFSYLLWRREKGKSIPVFTQSRRVCVVCLWGV